MSKHMQLFKLKTLQFKNFEKMFYFLCSLYFEALQILSAIFSKAVWTVSGLFLHKFNR